MFLNIGTPKKHNFSTGWCGKSNKPQICRNLSYLTAEKKQSRILQICGLFNFSASILSKMVFIPSSGLPIIQSGHFHDRKNQECQVLPPLTVKGDTFWSVTTANVICVHEFCKKRVRSFPRSSAWINRVNSRSVLLWADI